MGRGIAGTRGCPLRGQESSRVRGRRLETAVERGPASRSFTTAFADRGIRIRHWSGCIKSGIERPNPAEPEMNCIHMPRAHPPALPSRASPTGRAFRAEFEVTGRPRTAHRLRRFSRRHALRWCVCSNKPGEPGRPVNIPRASASAPAPRTGRKSPSQRSIAGMSLPGDPQLTLPLPSLRIVRRSSRGWIEEQTGN